MSDVGQRDLLDWKEAFAAGTEEAGGKGWNLARLDRYGFPVPVGGVLAARAYRDFIGHNGMRARLEAAAAEMDRLDPSGGRQRELSEEIERLFRAGEVPPALESEIGQRIAEWGLSGVPLAVRSSAAGEDSQSASFAGIHASTLNVRGAEGLRSAVRACWASVWSPRAAAYRRRMGLAGEPAAPAVVIMAMVDAVAAGVAFSCHPGSGREDQVFVSANFGLGESVVGGSVDPDEYVVRAGFHALGLSLVSRRTGRKERRSVPAPAGGTALVASPGAERREVLSDGDVLRLARLVRRAYCALGDAERHQDVEWVFDGRDFHLVQARPVTAVPRYTYPGLKGQPAIWSNANFRDTLPGVIPPLSWSTMADALDTVLQAVLRAVAYPLLPGLARKRLYLGRGYFDASVIQWESYDGFGSPPAQVNALLGGHHPSIRLPPRQGRMLPASKIRRNLAFMRAARRVRRGVGAQFEELIRRVRAVRERDLGALGDAELLGVWSDLVERFREAGAVHFALIGSGSSLLMMTLLLERYFPVRGGSLANALLAGQETTTSAEHGYRLARLSRTAAADPDARAFLAAADADPRAWRDALPPSSPFRKEFEAFLEEYGHRGLHEWDIRTPRWREDQSWLLEVVRANVAGLSSGAAEDLRRRQRETSGEARREVFGRLPLLLRPWMRRLVEGAARETVQREMARSTLARVVEVGRMTALECARRLVERGLLRGIDDVFFAFWEELQAVLTGEDDGHALGALVADRRARFARLEAAQAPDFLEADTPHRAPAAEAPGGDVLEGLGVASGRAEGPARLIRDPAEGGRLLPGDVLVAPGTDPAWTPLFLRASALVMETGGIISHGAIVAREYGIPAVINVPRALDLLPEGVRVVVDGDRGRVHLARVADDRRPPGSPGKGSRIQGTEEHDA